VTVWEVELAARGEAAVSSALYDMAGVYLRYGVITVTTRRHATSGQTFEVRAVLPAKGHHAPGGGPGKPGDPERLAIMWT